MNGARCAAPAGGFSLLELLLVLGLTALLGLVAIRPGAGSPALDALQGELRASLEQAFLQARSRGCAVRVAPGGEPEPVRALAPPLSPPLTLPRGVRWGLPAHIPLPAGTDATRVARRTGMAHARVTVTPAGAEASLWFLTDGRDAVCLRLAPHGQLTLLRWRQRKRLWMRA